MAHPAPRVMEAFPLSSAAITSMSRSPCPWAHRTLIPRSLKGLEAIISVSVVHWRMLENGWTFEDGPGVVPDPNLGAKFLYEIYIASDPNYTGRVTVPVLWDKRRGAIVNNESSDTRVYDTLNNGVYKAGFATSQSAY